MAAFESKPKMWLITCVYAKKLAHLALWNVFQIAVVILHDEQSISFKIYGWDIGRNKQRHKIGDIDIENKKKFWGREDATV